MNDNDGGNDNDDDDDSDVVSVFFIWLETSLFSHYMYIWDIFSQSVVYIFVLLSVSPQKKFLTFINYKYKSYIMLRSSGVLRNPCVPENHGWLPIFSYKFYSVTFLI